MKQLNPAIQKLQRDKFVNTLFNEYKNFVGNDRLPNYDIRDLRDDGSGAIAKHKFIKEKNQHLIFVDKNLHIFKAKARPYVYHEFTHLLDYATLFTDSVSQEMLLNLYTEYHASQIQMMTHLNFEHINSDNNIYLSNIIEDLIVTHPLISYLGTNKNDYLNDIQAMILKGNSTNLDRAFTYLMYYLGKINICEKHSSEKLEDLSNVQEFANILGDEVFGIAKLLYNIEPITEDKLIELTKYQVEIMRRFK